MRLRAQSRSSTQLRASLFRACFKGVSTLWHHYRTVQPPRRFRASRLRTPTCVRMLDGARKASQSHSLSQRGSNSGRGAGRDSIAFHRLRGPPRREDKPAHDQFSFLVVSKTKRPKGSPTLGEIHSAIVLSLSISLRVWQSVALCV